MLGVKLRSEKVDRFDALGEKGQPTYVFAAQILSILKNKRPDLIAHFAVPQASEDGSVIDWYAPRPGTVVPWSAATPEEQSAASARLHDVRQSVMALHAVEQAKGSQSTFAQLLRWIIHHPDLSYVFLVDGQPVMTFWGFLNRGADRSLDPLHALRPVAPVVASVTAPVSLVAAATVPVALPVVASTPWWKRWWLWLLLLLLLLALLFGLRACMPSLMPGLALPGVDLQTTTTSLPDVTVPNAPESLSLPGGGTGWRGHAAGVDEVVPSTAPQTMQPDVSGAPDFAPPQAAAEPSMPPAGDVENVPDGTNGQPGSVTSADASPSLSDTVPPTLPEGEGELTIPASAGDGKAGFLNGTWRAGAGIQDKNTGEPLRLQYEFKNGEGQVTLNRRSGVQCTAPVSAAMNQGALAINNGGAAKCSDGGTYEMPAIQCKPGEKSIASCIGSYGSEQFPLSMREKQP